MKCYINRIKDNIHVIILVDTEKAIDKNPTPFHDRNTNKLGLKGNVLNLMNNIY